MTSTSSLVRNLLLFFGFLGPSVLSFSTTSGSLRRLPPRAVASETAGSEGATAARLQWEDVGGNAVLRPPPGVPVRSVVHFLGGAFVGAAPHVTYRYLLNGLAQQGYLVVTTPYRLAFDYLEVCDSILECFERAAVPLAKQHGALPVVGMGHSCGALLQVYITCLFPDTPRAANALISFNNKPAKEAIPAFDELVVPIASAVMADTPEGKQLRESIAAGRQVLVDGVSSLAGASACETCRRTSTQGWPW